MHISSDLMPDQLDEISLKGAVAAGALAAAAVTGGSTGGSPRYLPDAEAKSSFERETFKGFAARQEARAKELAATVLEKYSINDELALKIAKLAIKYEKPKFPRAEDILSVIGIESAFRPHAVSKLKKDPAMGLMQVRPVMWKQNPDEFKANIEQQIKLGSDILHKYYQKVGTVNGTLQAYNVGLGNYLKKKGLNPRYVPKFEKDREMYEAEISDRARLLDVQSALIEQLPDEFEVDLDRVKDVNSKYVNGKIAVIITGLKTVRAGTAFYVYIEDGKFVYVYWPIQKLRKNSRWPDVESATTLSFDQFSFMIKNIVEFSTRRW